MGENFQNINFDLDKLPSMPLIAAQMMELSNDQETSAADLVEVVAKDFAVSARVLKIANSSFYSMSRQVTSLLTAVVILGERTLKNLVLASSMREISQSSGEIEQLLWEDSMVCALGSRYLAAKLALADPEEAFMAGLFRHIGLVVLNNQESTAADYIASLLKSCNQETALKELELFGVTHAEIGAAVLEHWNLSEVLCLVTLHHSDVAFAEGADSNAVNMACVVNIAGRLPGYFGIFGQSRDLNLENLPGPKLLNLDLERVSEIIEEFHSIFEENRSEFLS